MPAIRMTVRRIIEFRKLVGAARCWSAGRHGRGLQPYRFQWSASAIGTGRIVPGYYHRLNAEGKVEDSTCQPCGNTASEHMMTGKLIADSLSLDQCLQN
jgi:hypothetical protein